MMNNRDLQKPLFPELDPFEEERMNREKAAACDNVYGAGLDYYKGYVKRVLGRAKTDESFAKLNKENVFWAEQAAGLVSIAEFGNEKVKQHAMHLLETAFFYGKTKTRNNHAISKLITKVWEHD